MAADNSIIVLDDDDEDEAAVQPGPSHPPPNPASPPADAPADVPADVPADAPADAPASSQPHGAGGNSSSGGKKCYKLENEKLFEEVSFVGEDLYPRERGAAWLSCPFFLTNTTCLLSLNPSLVSLPPFFPETLQFLELCKAQTEDHPDVVPFLCKRQQRAHALFLASAEFCNILSRVLSRARSRPAKLYVYINELCTVLKAHSAKKKMNIAPAATTSSEPSGSNPPADPSSDPTNAETTGSEAPRTRGSRRQIQRLEQLLALYVAEIRRLQEKELDLQELDDPDSTYLQEARLKRKLIRLFGRLCELKDCSSLTGRVIEQRIPYRGTRYPEVNRRIERLINKPGPDTFPDYGDVLRAVEKAAVRHSLGLPRQQLQLMAQDAFRDVGIRLQERRHLDLIYNFGCHLTDDYRPGRD